jgi:hypothetical protein
MREENETRREEKKSRTTDERWSNEGPEKWEKDERMKEREEWKDEAEDERRWPILLY